MGFNWIYLNPFHQPGFSGSLYAVKDYYRLHPLMQGDAESPPAELLRSFVRAACERDLHVMMDFVINHTSKDSLLVDEHPEFFLRTKDGALVSPSAIDPADARKVTVWGDLAEIDYTPRPARSKLMTFWKQILSHHAELGFRGFRCDAAYKVPGEVWEELIKEGRSHSDVVFFAETLGCRQSEMEQLAGAGFDYFFNSAKWWDFRAPWLLDQYESFRHVAPSVAFPESHDTPRLATELAENGVTEFRLVEATYRLRYLFATFFSSGVMMPMGFEYGYRRKLHVVSTRPQDVEQPLFDLTAFVARANQMKREVAALREEGPQRRLTSAKSPVVALLRATADGASRALALINPSRDEAYTVPAQQLLGNLGQGWRLVCETGPDAMEGNLASGKQLRLRPLAMHVLASDSAG
ncbi:MAG: alpha-amylase family glycosyl hydrolase, partial [Polyangiaceae bacterium]|nr:alpha-amylase family glycosyl hydrolase [Polyangiaceae bacterium]